MLQFLRLITRFPPSGRQIGLIRRWMSVKTTVMSFGDGSQDALGLATSPMDMGLDAFEPTPISGLPPDVSHIAAGHYHSIAVTSLGHVWSWGRNSEAQLGRGQLSPRETWSEPQRAEGLNEVRVRTAFASGVVSAAIGDDGSLWVWGKSKRGQLGLGTNITKAVSPARVEVLLGEVIVKVALGWGHALALTEDGKVFGWGYYADGRLGNIGKALEASPLDSYACKVKSAAGDSNSSFKTAEKLVLEAIEKEKDMPVIWEPTLIEELHNVHVVDMACGLDHSLILTRDGALFSAGSNVYGQLGRAKQELGLHPVDTSLCPTSIASGLGHSLAICQGMSFSEPKEDAASIVSWGWNQNSQLGREGPENSPKVVESLTGEQPVLVSGGRVHSIAITAKKEVWTWGCGRNGRLGLGNSTNEAEPTRVECLQGLQVLQASAGFDHNLVLVAEL